MSSRRVGLWVLGVAAASFFIACRPKRPATSFVIGDWRLTKAIQDAAKAWADNGIETWRALVEKYFKGALKPPFNDAARTRAGLQRAYYAAPN